MCGMGTAYRNELCSAHQSVPVNFLGSSLGSVSREIDSIPASSWHEMCAMSMMCMIFMMFL